MSPRSHHRRVFQVGLAFAAFAPLKAWAQPAEVGAPPPVTAVEERLRRGVELRRAGRDEEALVEFAAAHRLAPSPRTAAQLGLAHQALGAWLDADRLLREALASAGDPWASRNRAALSAALEVVGRRVGLLEVRGNVPGAEVRVEGAPVATLPMREPVRVMVGALSVEVSAPGYVTASRRFMIDPGALVRESVELRPAPPPPPPAPTASPAPTPPAPSAPALVVVRPLPPRVESTVPWWRRWAWAPLAVGGAAVAFGGVALGLREVAAHDYNSRCPANEPPDAGCADLVDAAGAWEVAGWTSIAAGGALVVAGVTMLLVPARRGGAALRCEPSGAGAACALRF